MATAFPTAERVAAKSEDFFRKKIRLGYRAPYLKHLATRFARREITLRTFTDPSQSIKDLVDTLGTFKGFGPYAINSLLFTLGRYDALILQTP